MTSPPAVATSPVPTVAPSPVQVSREVVEVLARSLEELAGDLLALTRRDPSAAFTSMAIARLTSLAAALVALVELVRRAVARTPPDVWELCECVIYLQRHADRVAASITLLPTSSREAGAVEAIARAELRLARYLEAALPKVETPIVRHFAPGIGGHTACGREVADVPHVRVTTGMAITCSTCAAAAGVVTHASGFPGWGPPTLCGEGEAPAGEPAIEVTCPACVEIVGDGAKLAARAEAVRAELGEPRAPEVARIVGAIERAAEVAS